jgi:hypothetical protein
MPGRADIAGYVWVDELWTYGIMDRVALPSGPTFGATPV